MPLGPVNSFLTEEVRDMILLPDRELFHDVFARGESFDDFKAMACAFMLYKVDAVSEFRAEIASIALEINKRLVPRNLSDFNKKVTIADFLSKQKIRISIPKHYLQRVAAGPFDRWTVDKILAEWDFEPTAIKTTIKKRVKYPSRELYVEFTFCKK